MTRQEVAVLLLLVLGTACRSAGPQTPAGPATLPEPLAGYQGEVRVLPHGGGDAQTVKAGPGKELAGGCDVAVHVRAVAFEDGTARFSLDNIGLPKVRGRAERCEQVRPGLLLFVEGLGEGTDDSVVRAQVDRVLQTPEAYLGSKGVGFDLPPGEAPAEVASGEVYAPVDEKMLSRQVETWPEALLSVDPWYHHGSGRIRQEGEVEVEAIVGTDGRIHTPRIKTGMGASHERAVLRVLPLWRFEPARGPEGPVGARVLLSPILRIF
jgi:hypothetical protein